MRRALIVLLLAGSAVVAASAEEVEEIDLTFSETAPYPMSADLKACIETNAGKVERAGEPMSASIDLLVEKICAAPLAAMLREQQALLQARYKASMAKMCARMKANGKVGEDQDEPNACDSLDDGYTDWTVFPQRLQPPPADATALAATLLLELRTQRLDAKPQ